MKITNLGIPAVVFVLVTGCAPLQQAPLIYSSKTSIGIDLSTPTSEQPGVSINVGFKMVDAAYVPVAVAKDCDISKGAKSCEDATYQIKDVTAYNNSDDSRLPDMRTEEARNIVSQLTSLASARDTAKSKLDDIKQHEDSSESDNRARAQLIFDEAQESLVNYIKDPKVKNLAANLKLVASIDAKQDAYSVFGSFDGRAGANGRVDSTGKPTAETSLVVGKVFSTGVASQFLTQGLKALYAGKGNSACIAQAVALRQDYMAGLDPSTVDANKQKMAEFASKLVAMCSVAPLSTAVQPAG